MKFYEEPFMDVISFGTDDVIITSAESCGPQSCNNEGSEDEL